MAMRFLIEPGNAAALNEANGAVGEHKIRKEGNTKCANPICVFCAFCVGFAHFVFPTLSFNAISLESLRRGDEPLGF
jgi:hypothetical protein